MCLVKCIILMNFFFRNQIYGVLDGEKVVVNGQEFAAKVDVNTDVAFFYGLPEIGQNLVWKEISSDPSLFLSFYQKVKSFLKPLQVLLRYRKIIL